MTSAGNTSPYHHHHPHAHHSDTKSMNGLMDDDDGRTRNAKAQRRHREKRKAHLKTLEETVQHLTTQLEDARRQLSSGTYRPGAGGAGGSGPSGTNGAPLSPGSKDFVALQQENTYLREENAELRRQLYSYGGGGGGGGGAGGGGARHGYQADGDVKQEGYAPYGQGPLASPREGSNGTRQDGQVPSNNDQYTPRGSRSRVMSSSSAPAVSPYLPSTSAFPTDPRAHALSQPPQLDRYPPVRYDSHIYPSSTNHSPTTANQPPPHNIPRSGLGYDHMDMYSGGRDDGGSTWGPDAGPPPFQGSVYPVPYGDSAQQDDWRQNQDHSH